MTLAHLLSAYRPPRLSDLRRFLGEAESYMDFVALVRRFLPEHEGEILEARGVDGQVAVFANRFRGRYFPLYPIFEEGLAEEYEELTSRIPFIPLGISDEDYANVADGYSLGHRLLFALVGSPFYSDGDRVVLLETLATHVPRELLQRLPEDGHALATLHALLDGTEYETAVKACDWLWSSTGIFFLDADDEYVSNVYEPWAPEVVEEAARDWREAMALMDQVGELAHRLERDPEAEFRKLLDFITQQEVITNEQGGNLAGEPAALEEGAGDQVGGAARA